MLEKEYQYYEKNKETLLKKYLGSFLLISGESVLGNYESEAEAYRAAQKKGLELGTFLIQECRPDSILKETFHSRVIFDQ